MPTRASRRCPRCRQPYKGDRCEVCKARDAKRIDADRGTPAERGYDLHWARIRAAFLKQHPTCDLCGEPAVVADHHPTSRRDLVAQGDPHPDAWSHLRPLCRSCDRTEGNAKEPGGWNRPGWTAT